MDTEQKKAVLRMAKAGLSQRQIAVAVLGSESKKSTIGDFLRNRQPGDVEAPAVYSFDIETSPFKGYAWRRWKENIGQSQVIAEGQILCWAAKRLGTESIEFSGPDNPKDWDEPETERAILEQAWDLFHRADVIIAHNGKSFDVPYIYTRMLKHGMSPPSPFKVIDTLKVARSLFRFPSNRLDDLAAYLGLGRKAQTGGFDLWKGCMEGDPKAWDTMQVYNIQDVDLLEEVYKVLRPWDKQHPNLSLMIDSTDTPVCPACLSTNLKQTDKQAYTGVSAFPMDQCMDCGKWSRQGTAVTTTEERKALRRNVT